MDTLFVWQTILSLSVTAMLAVETICGAIRVLRPAAPLHKKTIRPKATLTAGLLFGAACAAGAAFFAFYGLYTHPEASLEQALRWVFPTSIDADHYIKLAQYGYGNGANAPADFADQHLMIVFFPLFPLLLRLGCMLTGLSGYIVGWLIQPFLLGLAGAGLFRLTAQYFGEKTAAWTLVFFACMPGSFFFAAPMTESLYLALTVWALVFLEENCPIPFAILGFLAALTRSTGGLLAGVALIAAVQAWRQSKKWKCWLAAAFAPCGGTGIYLLLNWYYYGDWRAFSKIQKQHWSQGLGWIGKTVRYLLSYMVQWFESNRNFAVYVSFAGVVCILWACLVLFLNRNRLPVCWLAYGVAYVLTAYGVTWLLSAPRYALSLPMLPLGMVLICKKDWQRVLFVLLESVMGVLYLRQFLLWGPIY